jgi:hypothetical protein
MPAAFLQDHPLIETPNGETEAVPDWPERGSPVPRLTIAIDDGRCIIRTNVAWRQLVLSTVSSG